MLAALSFSPAAPASAELAAFNQLTLRVRLVAAFALLFLTVFMRYATALAIMVPALVCTAGALLLAVIAQREFLKARRPRQLAAATALLFVADLALLGFLVNFSGGPGSFFLFGYFAVIIGAGVAFAEDGAYAAATIATLTLGALTLGKYFHIPPLLALFPFERALVAEPGLLFLTMTVVCFLFYLTAMFTARVGQLVTAARAGELRALRRAADEQRLAATGRLAAGLAHEINNPLAGIASYIQYLMAAPQPPDRAQLQPVLDEVERASRIIRPLLQLARGGDTGTAPGPVDAAVIAAEMRTLLAPAMAQRDVTLTVELPPALVLARPDALRQVFTNLLLNAADATPPGGHITIAPAAETATGCSGFTVRDTGCGISADVLARIGEPFFTTKPPGQGTGLGLAVTRQLLHELGGSLQLQSTPGRGTTVTVLLPAAPEGSHA